MGSEKIFNGKKRPGREACNSPSSPEFKIAGAIPLFSIPLRGAVLNIAQKQLYLSNPSHIRRTSGLPHPTSSLSMWAKNKVINLLIMYFSRLSFPRNTTKKPATCPSKMSTYTAYTALQAIKSRQLYHRHDNT